MATAKISSSNSSLRAQINSNNSSGPKQVSVTVPSVSTSSTKIKSADPRNATDKFITKTIIGTETGKLRLSGGNF